MTMETTRRPAVAIGWGLALSLWQAAGLAAGWPTYLHDPSRSGVSPESIAATLTPCWTFQPRHAPRPAWPDPGKEPRKVCFDLAYHVAADERCVYFGSSGDHKVYCLDAATGRVRWEVFTGAPVRLGPTLWEGRVYAGSDDGIVYCLAASDGETLWTFRGALTDRRIVGNGRLMSPWPVRTGVAVVDGVAYFAAGLFPAEGVVLYALDAKTGREIWCNATSGQIYRQMPHPGAEAFSGVPPQGAIAASANRLYLPTGRNVPAAFDMETGRLEQYTPQAKYRVGGTYVVAAGDVVYSGPTGLTAYRGNSGDVFARFPAQRILITPDTVYLLGAGSLTAVDRKQYTALRVEYTTYSEQRKEVYRARWRANLDMGRLRKKPDPDEAKIARLQKKYEELDAHHKALTAKMTALDKPMADCVRWTCKCPPADALIRVGAVLFAGGKGQVTAVDEPRGVVTWSAQVPGKVWGLAAAGGRLFVSTDTGAIVCFASPTTGAAGPAPTVGQPTVPHPYPQDALSPIYAQAAATIVKRTGITRGYALVLNCGEGRLAYELATRTQLRIVGVEPDHRKAEAARRRLDAAGLYAERVVVDEAKAEALPYADYVANLVVCDDVIVSGKLPSSPREALRVLRPCGGVAFIGRPAAVAGRGARLDSRAIRKWLGAGSASLGPVGSDGAWAQFVRGPLSGAGTWTHQYANAGNTGASQDRLVKGPLGMLWFGDPGPAQLVNRHAKPPAPLAIGGRLFVSGDNIIYAVDAYNGFPLWQRELPGARRVSVHGEASNFVAAADSLYVVLKDRCLRLDPATGRTLGEVLPPPPPANESRLWGYLAVEGDVLLGAASLPFTTQFFDEDSIRAIINKRVPWRVMDKLRFLPPRRFKTRQELEQFIEKQLTPQEFATYKEPLLEDPGIPTGGVMSDSVFGLDRVSGKVLWAHPVKIGYVHNIAIAAGAGRVYLAESHEDNPGGPRRVAALDLGTGRELWSRSVDVPGCGGVMLGVYYADGVVLMAGASGGTRVVALSAKDGAPLWNRQARYTRRPLVAGGSVFVEPEACGLSDGQPVMREHPITGQMVRWQFARAYGCGAVSGCRTMLSFRSGTVGLYDLAADEGTSNWGGVRPGCWVNLIPAAGLLLAPEGSSGCTCSYPIQCTMALVHTPRNENWAVFNSPGPVRPVKHLAVNLGAPGDRRDGRGRLWLSFPRPPARRALRFDMRCAFAPGSGYFHHNADARTFDGPRPAWVLSSGARGMRSAALKLVDKGPSPAHYTVRLTFVETLHTQPGKRCFDIKLQGQVVARDVDVVEETGARGRGLVKAFTHVPVAEWLTIELPSNPAELTPAAVPMLCGIEAEAE